MVHTSSRASGEISFLKQSAAELHLVPPVSFGTPSFGRVSHFLSSSQETRVTREGSLILLFPKQLFFHAVGQDRADLVTQQRRHSSRATGSSGSTYNDDSYEIRQVEGDCNTKGD